MAESLRNLQESQARLTAECEELRQEYMEMYNNYNSIQEWIKQAQPMHDQLIPQYNDCRQHSENISQIQKTINNLMESIQATKQSIEQKISAINFLEFKYQYGEVNESNIYNKIAQANTLLMKSIKLAESLQNERQQLIEEIDRATQESRATEQDIEPIRRQTLNDTNSTRIENKKLHEEIAKLSVKCFAGDLRFQSQNLSQVAHAHYFDTLSEIAKIDSLCKTSLHRALSLEARLAEEKPPGAKIVDSFAQQLDSLIPLPAQYDQILAGAEQKAGVLLDEHTQLLTSIREAQMKIEAISALSTEVHILDDNLRTQNDMLQFDQNTLSKHVTRLKEQNMATQQQIEQTQQEIAKRTEEIQAAMQSLEATKRDASRSNTDVEEKRRESMEKEAQCAEAQKELEEVRKKRFEHCQKLGILMDEYIKLQPTVKPIKENFVLQVAAVDEEARRADYAVFLLASLERQLAYVQKENADFTLNSETPIGNLEFIKAITSDGVTLDRVFPEVQHDEEGISASASATNTGISASSSTLSSPNAGNSGSNADKKSEEQAKEKGMYVVASGRGQRLAEFLFHPQNIEPNYPQIVCLLLQGLKLTERTRFVQALNTFVEGSQKEGAKISYKHASHSLRCGPFPPQGFPPLTTAFVYERYARFIMTWVNFDCPTISFQSVADIELYGAPKEKDRVLLLRNFMEKLKNGIKYAPICQEALTLCGRAKDGLLVRELRAKIIRPRGSVSGSQSVSQQDFKGDLKGDFKAENFPIGVNPVEVVNCYAYYHMQLYKDISASDITAFIEYRRTHDTSGQITQDMIAASGKMGPFLEEFDKLKGQIRCTVNKETSLKERVLSWVQIATEAYYKFGDFFLCDALDSAFAQEGITQKIQKFPEARNELGKLVNGVFATGNNPTKGRKLWIPEITKFHRRIAELNFSPVGGSATIKLGPTRKIANEIVEFLKGQDRSYEFQVNMSILDKLKKLRTP